MARLIFTLLNNISAATASSVNHTFVGTPKGNMISVHVHMTATASVQVQSRIRSTAPFTDVGAPITASGVYNFPAGVQFKLTVAGNTGTVNASIAY